MMNGWTSRSVADSQKSSFPQSLNGHRLANDVKQWRGRCACNAQCSKPVEPSLVKIMSMVFGVESLKRNGMLPVIDSLRLLASALFLSVNLSANVSFAEVL
jgi:hypothetical protein